MYVHIWVVTGTHEGTFLSTHQSPNGVTRKDGAPIKGRPMCESYLQNQCLQGVCYIIKTSLTGGNEGDRDGNMIQVHSIHYRNVTVKSVIL